MPSPPDLHWLPRHNPWAVAMTVTMATFMEVLDTSIANVSLPHIAGNLSISEDESTWILTSYLVANAVVLPISGWLSGLFGRKRFYTTCVALFTISSFLCGLAPSLTWLIVFRVLQGAGGGGLQPSEQAILADLFPPARRGMAFAVYGMAVVLAPAIGPTLGGFITDTITWRWIFFINIPVGIVSLLLSARLVEDPPWARGERMSARQIDFIGLSLIVLGLGCLQFVLDQGEREDWFASNWVLAGALLSGICLLVAIAWEARHPRPVLDVRLFGTRNLAVGTAMMFTLGAVLFGTTVLLPLYLQTLLGYTATQAGEVLSPGGVLVIALLPLVGFLVSRVDPRWLIACGFGISALALFHMSGITLEIDFRTAVFYRLYQSAGLAFLFVPITTLAYVGVAMRKNNQVSAIVNLARNMGGSVGIALTTTLIARREQFHQERLVSHLTALDQQLQATVAALAHRFSDAGSGPVEATRRAYAAVYRSVLREATAMAYQDAIWLLAIVCASLVVLVFVMRRGRGTEAALH